MPPKPAPMTPLSQRLRHKANVNCNPDPDPASREDLPYVTWAELDAMSADMIEAAEILDVLGALRPRVFRTLSHTDVCPVCGGAAADGHFEECWLRDLLAVLPEEGPT